MAEPTESSTEAKNSNKLNVSIDLRLVCAVLLVIIGAMFALWRPWEAQNNSSGRTITVTGESTVKAVPDEFVFSPQYEFKNADKAAALADVTAKQNEIISELKKLGVKDDQIKADSGGYNFSYYYDESAGTNNYTLSLTITLSDKTLTQKVQDYLVTTQPTGSVSPQANFSDAKQKELQSKGRDAATKEARAKADQSAKNLGFKVGAVKSVTDSDNGTPYPIYGTLESGANLSTDSKQSLSVQPGKNDLTYTVTVVYYLK